MGTWPDGRCDMRPSRTDKYHKNEAFPLAKIEMYSTICVEWAGDHFGLGLTKFILTKMCAKTMFIFSFPVILTFDL